MKNIITFVFIIGVIFGCSHGQDGCAGDSTFFVKNESDKTLIFESVSKYFNGKNDSLEVVINKILRIGEEDAFGYNPIPSNRYAKINISIVVNNKKNLVLNLDPVKNKRWTLEAKKIMIHTVNQEFTP